MNHIQKLSLEEKQEIFKGCCQPLQVGISKERTFSLNIKGIETIQFPLDEVAEYAIKIENQGYDISIKDLVPKAVIHFLVFKTKDTMQQRLIKKFYNDTNLPDLFAENPALVNERKVLKQNLDALKKALDILNEVRDQCL